MIIFIVTCIVDAAKLLACSFSILLNSTRVGRNHSLNSAKMSHSTEPMELNDIPKYQTIKKVVRGILVANGANGMTLQRLIDAYRQYEGHLIPYEEFGFEKVEWFLLNMKDTVVYRQGYCYPVTTSDNEHIVNMVQAQKKIWPRKPSIRPQSMTKYTRTPSFRPEETFRRPTPINPKLRYPPSNFLAKVSHGSRTGTIIQGEKFAAEKKNVPFGQNRSNQFNANPSSSVGPQYHRSNSYKTPASFNDSKIAIATNAHTVEAKHVAHIYEPAAKLVNENETPSAGNVEIVPTKSTAGKPDEQFQAAKNVEQSQATLVGNNSRVEDILKLNFADRNSLIFDQLEFDGLKPNDFAKSCVVGQTSHVYVAEIHSPYKFWLQTETDSVILEELMDRLSESYNSSSSIHNVVVPEEYRKVGTPCVALYEGVWHRAKIVDVLSKLSVKVFYVDYGTVDEVLNENLRCLTKKYAALPTAAIRSCIDRVRPKNGVWDLSALKFFFNKMQEYETTLLARVTAVNREEGIVYMDLIDTTSVIECNIGHEMLIRNFGYSTRKLLNDFTKRHWNEVYPSFADLENGQYPSVRQILDWVGKGFDFIAEILLQSRQMYSYETIE